MNATIPATAQRIVYPRGLGGTCTRYARLVRGFRHWPRYLAFKWSRRSPSVDVETRAGLRMEIPRAVKFDFKNIFLYEAYGFPPVLERLAAAPTVIDIGANVGFFSLYVFHRRPGARCLSFEPLTANFEVLRRQQHRNASLRWQVFREAVAGQNEEVLIGANQTGQPETLAQLVRPGPTAPEAAFRHLEPVPARSLAAIFADHALASCDWLKLDCEGSEYEILYAAPEALYQRIGMLSLETHLLDDERNNVGALCGFLEERGYQVFADDVGMVHALREVPVASRTTRVSHCGN